MTPEEITIVRELYKFACHHPRCRRSDTPHQCLCGVSAALEGVRQLLKLPDFSVTVNTAGETAGDIARRLGSVKSSANLMPLGQALTIGDRVEYNVNGDQWLIGTIINITAKRVVIRLDDCKHHRVVHPRWVRHAEDRELST